MLDSKESEASQNDDVNNYVMPYGQQNNNSFDSMSQGSSYVQIGKGFPAYYDAHYTSENKSDVTIPLNDGTDGEKSC